MAVQVPHFALPFRLGPSGHAVVVEQDTDEDVAGCVEAIVRTPRGDRVELPSFGIEAGLFGDGPDPAAVAAAIAENEPRADSAAATTEWLDAEAGTIATTVWPSTNEGGAGS